MVGGWKAGRGEGCSDGVGGEAGGESGKEGAPDLGLVVVQFIDFHLEFLGILETLLDDRLLQFKLPPHQIKFRINSLLKPRSVSPLLSRAKHETVRPTKPKPRHPSWGVPKEHAIGQSGILLYREELLMLLSRSWISGGERGRAERG